MRRRWAVLPAVLLALLTSAGLSMGAADPACLGPGGAAQFAAPGGPDSAGQYRISADGPAEFTFINLAVGSSDRFVELEVQPAKDGPAWLTAEFPGKPALLVSLQSVPGTASASAHLLIPPIAITPNGEATLRLRPAPGGEFLAGPCSARLVSVAGRAVAAESFRTGAAPTDAEGWQWLRQESDSAAWTFGSIKVVPTLLPEPLLVRLGFRVAGDAAVRATVTFGAGGRSATVWLNPLAGGTAAGYLALLPEDIGSDGTVGLTIRPAPGQAAPLGVRQEAVGILAPAPMGPEPTRPTLTLHVGNPVATRNQEAVTLDVAPYLDHDRTMVPLRFLAESLGAGVQWDAAQRRVVFTRAGIQVELWIGRPVAQVGDREVALEAAPVIRQDRTFVPLRFISEALGASVDYTAADQRIEVTAP